MFWFFILFAPNGEEEKGDIHTQLKGNKYNKLENV
jgi:hypothetical protein